MTSETKPIAAERISRYIWWVLCLALLLPGLWDYVHNHRWLGLAYSAAAALILYAIFWICRKYPVVVSIVGLALLVVRILGYGVGTFVGLFETYGWRTLLVDNWYVALIILYLPLMGLGWWAYTRRKSRKP
jgi:hypothetical protein